MKRLLGGLSLVLLASCAQKIPDFALLPPVTRIEARTTLKKPDTRVTKTITEAAEIARIVAAVDAEKSGWFSLPDSPQGGGYDVELSFYGSSGEIRQFVVHDRTVLGNIGGEWNLSAFAQGAQWVRKKASDEQIEALLAAIGPFKPPAKPSAKPSAKPPAPKKRSGQ